MDAYRSILLQAYIQPGKENITAKASSSTSSPACKQMRHCAGKGQTGLLRIRGKPNMLFNFRSLPVLSHSMLICDQAAAVPAAQDIIEQTGESTPIAGTSSYCRVASYTDNLR